MIFTSLHFKGYSLCYISCQPPVAAVLQSVLRKSEFKERGILRKVSFLRRKETKRNFSDYGSTSCTTINIGSAEHLWCTGVLETYTHTPEPQKSPQRQLHFLWCEPFASEGSSPTHIRRVMQLMEKTTRSTVRWLSRK